MSFIVFAQGAYHTAQVIPTLPQLLAERNMFFKECRNLCPDSEDQMHDPDHIPSDWLPAPSHFGSSHALTLFEIMFDCLYMGVTACMYGYKISNFDAINLHPLIHSKLSYLAARAALVYTWTSTHPISLILNVKPHHHFVFFFWTNESKRAMDHVKNKLKPRWFQGIDQL
jgi:hypothetical protein